MICWIPDTFLEKHKILAGSTILAVFLHLFCLLAFYMFVTFQGNVARWLLCGSFHIPQQLIRPQEYYSSRVRTHSKKTGECKVWTSQRTIDRLQGSKKRSGDLNAVIINIEIHKNESTWGCQKHFCLVFPVTSQLPYDRWIPSVNKHEMAASEVLSLFFTTFSSQ